MTMKDLFKAIFSIYENSAVDAEQRVHNNEVDSLLRILKTAEDKVLSSKAMAKMNPEQSSEIKNKLSLISETVDSQSFPSVDSRQDVVQGLAQKYVEVVSTFSQAGGTGFYDRAIILNVNYEMDVESAEALFANLQASGIDIHLVETFKVGNPENSAFRDDTVFCAIFSTSALAEVHKAVHDLKQTISMSADNYFITPVLNHYPSDPIAFVKNSREFIENEEGKKDGISLSAFTMLGLSRVETLWHKTPNPTKAIAAALMNPSLYRQERDHINGMMPTRLCYDTDECRQYGLSMTSKYDYMQPRNMLDEIAIFKQLNK